MKILHVIAEKTLRGGTEVFCVSLIRALKQEFDQEAIVRQGEPAEIASTLDTMEIPVHSFPLLKRSFKTFWGIKRVTRTFQPNIIMSWLPRASQLVPKGPWVHCAQVTWQRGLDCYEKADYLIVPTPHMKEHFSTLGVPSSHIVVLPHFTLVVEGAAFPKEKFNTPQDAFVILGLGRFDSVKGFDLLIKALPALSNPHIHLWLAGEGPEQASLEHLVKQLNLSSQVHFLGWQKNTADLLKTADVLVVPSRQEALGLIILEAWKNRCPVIATQTPGPLHLITPEQDGLLIPLEDPKAIAQGISRLYENKELRNHLSFRGYKKGEPFYTHHQTMKAYETFFHSLFKESSLL